MAKNGYKILDSDMHIMEPPDLWERYIDKKFQARAPRGIVSENVRDLRMAYPDGREWGNQTSEGNRVDRGQQLSKKPRHLSHSRRSAVGRRMPARSDGYRRHRHRRALSDPRPARAGRAGVEPEFAAAIARAYNDWMYDFCQTIHAG
jgi:hypothetical protein